jgi:hypothetical protein
VIGDGPGEAYFANRLNEEFAVSLAIVASAPSTRERLTRKYRSGGVSGVAGALRERAANVRYRRRREGDRTRWLGDSWRALSDEIPVVRTSSLDDHKLVARLASLGDVDLLVHASTIVGDSLLTVCRRALNLHWGLSPYYRGVRCTEWALMHWDTHNIGVTVHELRPEIDGGPILGQARARIGSDDTVPSINAQLSALGTDIVLEVLRIWRAGGDVERTPQDLTRGPLVYKRQWSGHLARHVAGLERRGLDRILSAPSRGELPIVELRRSVA